MWSLTLPQALYSEELAATVREVEEIEGEQAAWSIYEQFGP